MLNNVIKLLSNNTFDYCLIAFDAAKKTFRHEMMDTYKQNRTKTPDELIKQMNDCIIALKALGINVQQNVNFEADDLVGSFSSLMNANDIAVEIYSSDKDLLQLVNDKTNVNLMLKGISLLDTYDINNFSQKYFGLEPYQVIEYKSIIGDSSDCLPGVSGVGPKTGVDLIKKYKTIDNIYENLDSLTDSVKNKFINSKEVAFKCKKMATIVRNIFDNQNINDFRINEIDFDTLKDIANKYNLKDLKKFIEERSK